jgi:hypothetical protein
MLGGLTDLYRTGSRLAAIPSKARLNGEPHVSGEAKRIVPRGPHSRQAHSPMTASPNPEYESFPYFKDGKVIAHQDPLPFEKENDDASNTDTRTD